MQPEPPAERPGQPPAWGPPAGPPTGQPAGQPGGQPQAWTTPAQTGPGAWAPQPGYPAPGVTPGPPPQHPFSRTSGLAIVALITAIAGIVVWVIAPLVAFVLAAVASHRISGSGGMLRGKGLVTAARVTAGGVLAINALFIALVATNWSGIESAVTALGQTKSVVDLEIGDCAKHQEGQAEAEWNFVQVVPCNEPHNAEVGAVIPVTEQRFPGQERLFELFESRCADQLSAYTGSPIDEAEVGFFTLVPSQESWDLGDRNVTCLLATEPGQPDLTRSLRATG